MLEDYALQDTAQLFPASLFNCIEMTSSLQIGQLRFNKPGAIDMLRDFWIHRFLHLTLRSVTVIGQGYVGDLVRSTTTMFRRDILVSVLEPGELDQEMNHALELEI
jgi:hypothetical protein